MEGVRFPTPEHIGEAVRICFQYRGVQGAEQGWTKEGRKLVQGVRTGYALLPLPSGLLRMPHGQALPRMYRIDPSLARIALTSSGEIRSLSDLSFASSMS